jgi:hypothetical protein
MPSQPDRDADAPTVAPASASAWLRPPPQHGEEAPAAVPRRRAPPCSYSEVGCSPNRKHQRRGRGRRTTAAHGEPSSSSPRPHTLPADELQLGAARAPTSPSEGQELGTARVSSFLAARPSRRRAAAHHGRLPLPRRAGSRRGPRAWVVNTVARDA